MHVKELMSPDPACCTPDTNLQEVARLMCDYDCGEIPVVDDRNHMRVVGVVTDRDITCRSVAKGMNPLDMTAESCMSSPVVTVTPETSVDECCRLMEEHQIRRMPVVDPDRRCLGIVSQADVARSAAPMQTAEVVAQVSRPS
jgi:CBS domain-containing protein